MKDFLQRLEKAKDLGEIQRLIDRILHEVRQGQSTPEERRLFLRHLLLNRSLEAGLNTSRALDHLFSRISAQEWIQTFACEVEKELPRVLVELVDGALDVGHEEALRLVPDHDPGILLAILKRFHTYLEKLQGSARLRRGMRIARIQADLYGLLSTEPGLWRRRRPPPCCIDGKEILRLKEEKKIEALAGAYKARINQLQRRDLRRDLAALGGAGGEPPHMRPEDAGRTFSVEAPLRLGISSANASDNHLRSKEQGGKTLNAGIDLRAADQAEIAMPLRVVARCLGEPRLILRALSREFKGEFEVGARGDAATQSLLFFAYRRGGDQALRLAKQALVHTGIVHRDSADVLADISAFTGGGGLEISTSSTVLQGSGLGTSSILAAAILKVLYRLAGSPIATPEGEYPALYDQSLLLEQSIGLNSGWQDARGACGGPSAVKDFYAPPTAELPAPEVRFLDVDPKLFTERVVLFDTGISRAATRGLNALLDAYLGRDAARCAAMRESLHLHDEMVASLRQGDYEALGLLAARYWQLRCILDPEATSASLQHLFEAPELSELSAGGMLTGAGGGGFALLIAREGCSRELRRRLQELRKQPAYDRSAVVDYRLNAGGIQLREV